MSLVVTTQPVGDVLSVADLKAHLRIDIDAEDDMLQAYLNVAVRRCQKYTRRQFLTASFRYTVKSPIGDLYLPLSPLQEIVSVQDGDGNDVEYELDDTRVRAVITPETSPDRLVVDFSAGYGEAADIPEDIVHAVRIAASHYWASREDTGVLPPAVFDLLDPYRVRGFA